MTFNSASNSSSVVTWSYVHLPFPVFPPHTVTLAYISFLFRINEPSTRLTVCWIVNEMAIKSFTYARMSPAEWSASEKRMNLKSRNFWIEFGAWPKHSKVTHMTGKKVVSTVHLTQIGAHIVRTPVTDRVCPSPAVPEGAGEIHPRWDVSAAGWDAAVAYGITFVIFLKHNVAFPVKTVKIKPQTLNSSGKTVKHQIKILTQRSYYTDF